MVVHTAAAFVAMIVSSAVVSTPAPRARVSAKANCVVPFVTAAARYFAAVPLMPMAVVAVAPCAAPN